MDRRRDDVVAVLDAPPPSALDGASEVLCVWCGRVSVLGPACHRCGSPMEGSPQLGPDLVPKVVQHGFDTETLMRIPETESDAERADRRMRLRAARRRWLQP
jgi:hypothetical protein